MAFDYKKEYKEFYMPSREPGIVTVPSMNYMTVRGQGDPNAAGRRIQTVDRAFVWNCFYVENEPKKRLSDRRIFRLCRATA